MKPVDQFFALTGRTVDDRIAGIAATARAVLDELQRVDSEPRKVAGQKRRHPTIIGQWAARHLDLCVRTFERPPPLDLVELFTYLHQPKAPFAAAPDATAWYRAAHHKALHPDASLRDLALASGVSHTKCGEWAKADDFKTEARNARSLIESLGAERAKLLLQL